MVHHNSLSPASAPVDLNTKQEAAQEDEEHDEEDEEEEEKEEAPTYNEILTPAQLAQRQMIQDSLQMFQSSLAMRGQAEVKYFFVSQEPVLMRITSD